MRFSRVVRPAKSFFAILFLVSVAGASSLFAQSYDTEVSTVSYRPKSEFIFSRNGNSFVATDASGVRRVVRNSFQFDEESVVIPDSVALKRIVAVSYYGAVYAVSEGDNGCGVTVFTQQSTVSPEVLLSSEAGCVVTGARANVADRLLVAIRTPTTTRLVLFLNGQVETLWDAADSGLVSPRLESFTINDLNTAPFTISHSVRGARQFSSFFWVPVRGTSPLVFPKSAGKRPVVRDANNKNKYLITVPKGVGVFDPAKRRVVISKVAANRLTSNGTPFNATSIFPTNAARTVAGCFAVGALSGFKVQFAAITDERELVLLGTSPSANRVAKVIPFTVNGYPQCTQRRTAPRRR